MIFKSKRFTIFWWQFIFQCLLPLISLQLNYTIPEQEKAWYTLSVWHFYQKILDQIGKITKSIKADAI